MLRKKLAVHYKRERDPRLRSFPSFPLHKDSFFGGKYHAFPLSGVRDDLLRNGGIYSIFSLELWFSPELSWYDWGERNWFQSPLDLRLECLDQKTSRLLPPCLFPRQTDPGGNVRQLKKYRVYTWPIMLFLANSRNFANGSCWNNSDSYFSFSQYNPVIQFWIHIGNLHNQT